MNKNTRMIFGAALAIMTAPLLSGFTTGKAKVDNPYTGPALQRPGRILVYDFSSDINDIPNASPLRSKLAGGNAVLDPTHASFSRELGSTIAGNLAGKISEMGLFAQRATSQTQPQTGDIVFKGYFLSVDEGDAAKRVALGFGSGGAELKVTMEGYQMTGQGLQFLGSGHSSAETGKSPGAAVSLGVAIATSNPIGLIVGGALKAEGEASGRDTIDGAAGKITKLIASKLEDAFERQGWI